MVWRRLFRGRSSATTTTEAEPVDQEPVVTPPAAAPARGEEAPRFGGFSFEGPAAPAARGEGGQTSVHEGSTIDAATVEAPVPAASTPTADMVAAVRRKAGRRGARAADRGVGPVLIPSLREQALLYRLAAEARAADEPETTLALWKAYLELCPGDAAGWFLYGQCLLTSGHLDAAWGAFVETRRRQPTHGLAAGALGYLCMARRDAREAIRHFEEAVALAPTSGEMQAALAEALEAAGFLVEAAAARARVEALANGD